MRSLGSALTTDQRAMGDAVVKVVLSQQGGGGSYTYGVDTTNRILNLSHIEQEWSQTAQIVIDDRENNLTALSLEGYTAPISYGFGTNYSASAPMTVIAQKTDSLQGELATTLTLAGLFNLWGEQEATEAYTPDRLNTDTVKTILDAIAGATLTAFNTYPAHTITYDSGYDDSIINAFTPKDAFAIAKGESRLSSFRKVTAYLKVKVRVENDSGTATIHIFQPTITGDTYDYEYDDTYGDFHNFFTKSVRTRLVLPNKVVVMNHPAHSDTFTGNATDAASYAALGNQYYTKTVYVRAASNAECALIATAILQGYQIAAEKGHGFAPMNCGQEVMDYVKITDSRANDTRIGNIGYLHRNYRPGKFDFDFRFGSLLMVGLAGTAPPERVSTDTVSISDLTRSLYGLWNYVNGLEESTNSIITYLLELQHTAEFKNLSVTERFEGPMGSDMYD